MKSEDMEVATLPVAKSEQLVAICDNSETVLQSFGGPRVKSALNNLAGFVFALGFGPVTTMPDYFFAHRRNIGASTVIFAMSPMMGRRISRKVALSLAQKIRQRAERDVAEFAAWEASTGIQWE